MSTTMPHTRTANLGDVNKIPLGQGLTFNVDGEEIAVFRLRDGRIHATQSRCPHRGGRLADGLTGADVVACPLHAHRFDLHTGECRNGHDCIRTYPVREAQGQILLTLHETPAESVAIAG